MNGPYKFLIVYFIFLSQAQAGFLRMVPSVQVAASEDKPGVVIIAGTIENQGDETALDVKIESVRGSKLLTNADSLNAGEKKEINIELAEKELLIEKEGNHTIPLRVLYKDTNNVSFSAAFIISYTKKGSEGGFGRSSPVSLSLDEEARKRGGIDISSSGEMKLSLANTSAADAEVSLEIVSTKELEFKLNEKTLKLVPGEQKEVVINVKNINALSGSSYATYAMISGTAEDQAFTDYIGFVVNVGAASEYSFVTWALVFLAAIFAAVGFYYFKRESEVDTGEV